MRRFYSSARGFAAARAALGSVKPPCGSRARFLLPILLLTGIVLSLFAAPEVRGQEATPDATQQEDGVDTVGLPGIEEMIVTGYSSTLVGDLTATDSVVAWGEEDLLALGASDISDLAAFTPSLEIVTAGSTTPTFFIRGIGLNDFNANSTGAVAVYQDDVAINGPAIQLGLLFDTEAVNVQRGPQGVGQGRNASAGAIKVYSRKPSGDFGATLRTDFGNFDFQDYEGALEMPIVQDVLSARFAFRASLRDGWMLNRCAGATPLEDRVLNAVPGPRAVGPSTICGEPVAPNSFSTIPEGLAKNVNNTDVWGARGTFRFEPMPEMSWLLNVHGSRRDEFATLGQSIGTKGQLCAPGTFCSFPRRGAPDEIFDTDPSPGVLGGTQGALASADLKSGYIPIEIRQRLDELAPCFNALTTTPERCALLNFDGRIAANDARRQVAKELARELDSDPFAGDFNRTGKTTNDTWGGYLKGEFEIPGELMLATTTGFDRYRRQIDVDLDFSPETLFQTRTEDDGWQLYQDFTLSGTLFEQGAAPISWETGGWALREELDADVRIDLSANEAAVVAGVRQRTYHQNSSSLGGFAYVSIDFLDDFTLDGGLRYNWDQKDFNMLVSGGLNNNVPFQIHETFDSPTGSIRLSYRINEGVNVFAKYTHGWKPGTINATATQVTGPTVADPEKIDAFEFGLHGAWLEDRVTLDGSFFTYDYSDYQVFTAQQFFGGNTEFVVLNAKSAEVFGVEMDGNFKPWTGGLLTARFAWLETQFNDFTRIDQFLNSGGGGDPFTVREQQNAGNPLLNSPRFKVSLTAEQEFSLADHGALVLRYDVVWTGDSFYDQTEGVGLGNDQGEKFLPNNTIGQEAFWLHNIRTTWRLPNDQIELAGWVRNLENTAYKSYAFDASNFQSTTVFFVGEPRTYGLSLLVKFF